MRKRTEEEIQAYVEGYNNCFKQFCKCLDLSKIYNRKAVEKMEIFVKTTNSVIENVKVKKKEGEA